MTIIDFNVKRPQTQGWRMYANEITNNEQTQSINLSGEEGITYSGTLTLDKDGNALSPPIKSEYQMPFTAQKDFTFPPNADTPSLSEPSGKMGFLGRIKSFLPFYLYIKSNGNYCTAGNVFTITRYKDKNPIITGIKGDIYLNYKFFYIGLTDAESYYLWVQPIHDYQVDLQCIIQSFDWSDTKENGLPAPSLYSYDQSVFGTTPVEVQYGLIQEMGEVAPPLLKADGGVVTTNIYTTNIEADYVYASSGRELALSAWGGRATATGSLSARPTSHRGASIILREYNIVYNGDRHLFYNRGGQRFPDDTTGKSADSLGSTLGLFTSGNVFAGSDDRLKQNEVTITHALATIHKLNAMKYQKTSVMKDADFKGDFPESYVDEAGFIAQEVLQIPELAYCVNEAPYPDPYTGLVSTEKTMYFLNYQSVFVYAVAAIQELDTIVQTQQTKIEGLESENTLIKSKINEYNTIITNMAASNNLVKSENTLLKAENSLIKSKLNIILSEMGKETI